MNNVMLDNLPTEWNGYKVNTDRYADLYFAI